MVGSTARRVFQEELAVKIVDKMESQKGNQLVGRMDGEYAEQ
jgi:hypothetical protein